MTARTKRTRYPGKGVLTVAEVVLGQRRAPLTGWQRHHVIAAMTALGHTCSHISWVLCTNNESVRRIALRIGVDLHYVDQRPDWTAIDMVTSGAARIRLMGVDRVEAIRAMAPRVRSGVMAHRLRCTTQSVRAVAQAHGIPVIGERDPLPIPRRSLVLAVAA